MRTTTQVWTIIEPAITVQSSQRFVCSIPDASSIRAISKQRFSCGLFGDYEMTAVFEIPVYVINWCSEVLDIALDCFPCHDTINLASVQARDEIADNEVAEPAHERIEPDRSFSYLESAE